MSRKRILTIIAVNPFAGIKNAAFFLRKKQGDFEGDSGMQMLNIIDKSVDYSKQNN